MAKISVKQAAAGKSVMNLSGSHVTTFDFGQVRPSFYRHMNPSEKIKVDLSMMVRCAPLNWPAYGGARFIHRGFFVPYRLISPEFEHFYRGRSVNVDGVQSNVAIPKFTNIDLLRVITADSLLEGSTSEDDFHRFGNIDLTQALGVAIADPGEATHYGEVDFARTQPWTYVQNLFVKAFVGQPLTNTDSLQIPDDFAKSTSP